MSRTTVIILATSLVLGSILNTPAPALAQSFSGTAAATAGTVTHSVSYANTVYPHNIVTTVSEAVTGGAVFLSSHGPYRYGQALGAMATADPGFAFVGWSVTGSCTLSDSTAVRTILTVYDHFSLTASFTPLQYTLTTLAQPPAGGAVAITGRQASYHYGDLVRIDAASNPGYLFANWSVSGGSVDSKWKYWTFLTIQNNCTLTADFAPAAYSGTVAATGGTISMSRPGPYAYGQVLTVTVSPLAGNVFNHWTVTGGLLLKGWLSTTASLTVLGDFTVTAHCSESANRNDIVPPNVMLWPADWIGMWICDHGGPRATAIAQAHLAALRATGANYDWLANSGNWDALAEGYLTWSASMIRSAGLKVGLMGNPLYPDNFCPMITNAAGFVQADAVYFDVECTSFSTSSYDQLLSLANSMAAACQWKPAFTPPVYFFNTGCYFPHAAGSGACPANYQLFWDHPSSTYHLSADQAYANFTGPPIAHFGECNNNWFNYRTIMTTSLGYDHDPVNSHSGTRLGYFWFAVDSGDGNANDINVSPYLLGKLCTFLKSQGWPGVALYPGPTGYSATFSQDTTAFWEARMMSLVKTAVCSFSGSPYQVALLATGTSRPDATGSFAWAGTEQDSCGVSHPYYVGVGSNSNLPPWNWNGSYPANQIYYYLRHIDSGWAITTNSPGLLFCDRWATCWTRSGAGDDLTGMLGDYTAFQHATGMLHLASDPVCTLTTSANKSAWGTVSVTPSQEFYAPNQQVQIVAKPNPGRRFTGWTATSGWLLDTQSATTTLTLDGSPCKLMANFSR